MKTLGEVGYLGVLEYISTTNGVDTKRTSYAARTSRGGFLCPYKTKKTALKNTEERARKGNYSYHGTTQTVIRAKVLTVQFHIVDEEEVTP